MVIQVIGLGHIGLSLAAIIATEDFIVCGVDKPEVVDLLQQGFLSLNEKYLFDLFQEKNRSGCLYFQEALINADVHIIAVGTTGENSALQMTDLFEAVDAMLSVIRRGDLLIFVSTVAVGWIEKIKERIFFGRPELHGFLYIAYSPERGNPGNLLNHIYNTKRVIGGVDLESARQAKRFFARFVKADLLIEDLSLVELSKIAENAYREVNIAFSNELSIICEDFGVNVWDLISVMETNPRIKILKPGCGVGGKCLPYDSVRFVEVSNNKSLIVRNALVVNNYKTDWCINKIFHVVEEYLRLNKKLPVISVMGITYKPNSSGLNNSPAEKIALILFDRFKDNIVVVEPNLTYHNIFKLYEINKAIDISDLIVFLQAHSQFIGLDLPLGKKNIDFVGVLR